jgi:molybdopterin-guanine dinucleotide biosynthesis protein A
MGGRDKALLPLGDTTLLGQAIARARPQTGGLVLNANGDPARFAAFGLPVIADSIGGFPGPLAGIFAGLGFVREHRPQAQFLASFPCDCPFFPTDLVERLIAAAEAENADIAMAASAGRAHPVFAVWRSTLPFVQTDLTEPGARKVENWIARFPHTKVEFPSSPLDPFFNVNTEADLARAEALLAQSPSLR